MGKSSMLKLCSRSEILVLDLAPDLAITPAFLVQRVPVQFQWATFGHLNCKLVACQVNLNLLVARDGAGNDEEGDVDSGF